MLLVLALLRSRRPEPVVKPMPYFTPEEVVVPVLLEVLLWVLLEVLFWVELVSSLGSYLLVEPVVPFSAAALGSVPRDLPAR